MGTGIAPSPANQVLPVSTIDVDRDPRVETFIDALDQVQMPDCRQIRLLDKGRSKRPGGLSAVLLIANDRSRILVGVDVLQFQHFTADGTGIEHTM